MLPKPDDIILVEGYNELNVQMIPIEIPPPTTRLYGYLTDNETGQPVAGASITIYQDHDTKTETWHIVSDQYGFYEATDMLWGEDVDRTSMVIYAGGYETYVNENILIVEGDNELNIVLTWGGGSREVPQFIGYSVPSTIQAGSQFQASLTVWLPYQDERFRNCLRIVPPEGIEFPRWSDYEIELAWSLLPDSIYDECDPEYMAKEGYIRFDHEGEYIFSATGKATYIYYESYWDWRYKRNGIEKPLPLGTYNVEVRLVRNHVTVSKMGRLTSYKCPEHPACWFWGPVNVGTVEIV